MGKYKEYFVPIFWQEVHSWYGTSKKPTITSIILTLTGPLVLIILGFIKVAIENILTQIAIGLSGVVWFVIVMAISYIGANRKLFYQESEKLEKWERQPIKTDKVKLELINRREETNKVKILLKVTNNESFDLRNCFVVVIEFGIIFHSRVTSLLNSVNPLNSVLGWILFDPGQEKIVKGHGIKPELIFAVITTNGLLHLGLEDAHGANDLILHTLSREELLKRKYYLELGFNGEINGEPIDELIICGTLKKHDDEYFTYYITNVEMKNERTKE